VGGMSTRSLLIVLGLAVLGLLAAASIGYASYLVSRDSVGLPVTKLEDPQELTPRPRARARPTTVSTRTSTAEDRRREDRRATTGEDRPREPGDDNSGRGSGGSGSGSGGSGSSGRGSGGGGRGGDD
jgi:uncharacterized membrane protein YgcG